MMNHKWWTISDGTINNEPLMMNINNEPLVMNY